MLRLSFFILLVFGVVFGTATAHAKNPGFNPPARPQTIPAAITIAQGDVEAAVAKALVEKGAGDSVRANILTGKTGSYYEGTEHVTPMVTGLTFDKQSTRFSANIMLVSDNKVLSAVAVSGRYQQTVSLPVLRRSLRSGEQITRADIDFLDFPLGRLRNDNATIADQLIGQSPRATISPNRPIRVSELTAPSAIKKNALIVMRYKSPAIEITTSGQAMTNGAPGDVIEVRNLISRQVVRAVVENTNTVSVTPLSSTAQVSGAQHADAR